MANTVKIKKYSDVIEEYKAGGTITPGMLLQMSGIDTVVPHATAEGSTEKMFALEDELQGKTITDDYASGDKVQCWLAGRGDVVNAILTTGQTVAVGDRLISNGDGTLKKIDAGGAITTDNLASVVGVAVEAVTTTTSTARIKVRVI